MGKIDKATIDRIYDATNIIDVVSDFVSLKKRGSSYLGLCPFHNERTPSFSVSPARGIFKCFSCGKAGSAVSFLMDLEGMSYVEALKWLAKKYNIEVQEHERTPGEQAADARREALYAVNEYALAHFERILAQTDAGRQIGLSYLRHRGISDAMIARFHLGYALDQFDDLTGSARRDGYADDALVDTGLAVRTDRGTLYDRFKGRVIFPVHTLSGRVVAFGGRTLRTEKTVAKYVNSPESEIYSKSRELYGIYQARQAIARTKECILVEGYLDVISMHQAGVENVVASSGTSLTEGQIGMIKRFADRVTLIYDSDPAGIKASLRGINMLLKAGLSLRVVLLPQGDDPDSFAQKHTSAQVEDYIKANAQDLIGFKADTLLADAGSDPRRRSEAINDILESISLIPDLVEQSLYVDECARKTGIDSATLAVQLRRLSMRAPSPAPKSASQASAPVQDTPPAPAVQPPLAETDLIYTLLRYGFAFMCQAYPTPEATEPIDINVAQYIRYEMQAAGITLAYGPYRRIWDHTLALLDSQWPHDAADNQDAIERQRQETLSQGYAQIRQQAADMADIAAREEALTQRADQDAERQTYQYASAYLRNELLKLPDAGIASLVAQLTAEPVVLSKMYAPQDDSGDPQHMIAMVQNAVSILKNNHLKQQIATLTAQLATADDPHHISSLMTQIQQLKTQSMEYDKFAGEVVVTPK